MSEPTCRLSLVQTRMRHRRAGGHRLTRIDRSRDSYGAAANDMNMLVATGGRQRSEAEFRALYEAAGFRLGRIVPTVAPVSVVEGQLEY